MELLIRIARAARCAAVQQQQRWEPMEQLAMLTHSADRSIAKLQLKNVSHVWGMVAAVKSRGTARTATTAILCPRHVELAGLPVG